MKLVMAITFALLVQTASAEFEKKPWVDLAVSKVFQPSMQKLSEATESLATTLDESCEGPAGREAFLIVVEDFSQVEYYRLGAMNQANRAERLFFWPDRKGTGQKQMRRLLASPDRAALDAQALSKKSVALQGLPVLERILFAQSPEINAADCSVAKAIASNMASIAAELQQDWAGADGVASRLQNPVEDSVYRNEQESLSAVLTVAESALVSIAEKKIKALSKGLQYQGQLPKSAPFWRSGQTLINLRINLQSIESLLINSGMASSADAESSLLFEFQNAANMLNAIELSLAEKDVETARERLAALGFILESLKAIVSDTVAVKLGVVTGFNASDGD